MSVVGGIIAATFFVVAPFALLASVLAAPLAIGFFVAALVSKNPENKTAYKKWARIFIIPLLLLIVLTSMNVLLIVVSRTH